MKSVREFLKNTVKSDVSEINKKIAFELLDSYSTGNFLSIRDLSEKAFCSQSAITKYCKKLELSGYKELLFYLKNEKSKYLRTNIEKTELNESYIFESLEFYKQEIQSNMQWIERFKNKLSDSKSIVIFSCYQLMDDATFFRQYAEFKKINVKFQTIRHFERTNIDFANENQNALVLFFISGQDNNWLIEENYNGLNERVKKELFIFASDSQSEKLKSNNIYKLNSYKFYSGYEYRRLYLNILSLILLEDYKVI